MASEDVDDAKLQVLKEALYEESRQNGTEARPFTQQDLLDLSIIPRDDPILLLRVIQALTNERLFVAVSTQTTELAWRWRSREDAKKYLSLPNEETVMVYAVIDEAGADGIWNRTIKNKLKIHENVLKTCIKVLEGKGYIASMKNVEHPNKKMYIKANLRPSDRATGGPWFTDGEMDTPFIAALEELVFDYIKQHSAYLSSHVAQRPNVPKAPRKGIIKGSAPDTELLARGTKRAATEISGDDGTPTPVTAPAKALPERARGNKVYLPLPAGYKKYPTVTDIAQFIHTSGVTNNTTLGEADIQMLVDILHYDGLIEPIRVNGRRGYRVTRAAKQDTVPFAKRQQEREKGIGLDAPPMGVEVPRNGLTETPCGKCPVFELCEEGGPVSPSNCVYFLEWLDIEDAAARPNVVAVA
ncbi:hypothetical protein OQA88_11969 [Cercophora sp. LCS_1]